MNSPARSLTTRRGMIPFPAYIPVTTFGDKYPLDDLVRPYLPRLAPAVMVSYHYARQMDESPRIPILIDSGGFASLFSNTRIVRSGELGVLEISQDDDVETVHPRDVLDFQEEKADVALTLDFPIPPGMNDSEAQQRQELTIANALWALANRRRRDLPLYACVQAWDVASARACVQAYVGEGFDGIAIGGLVPRAQDVEAVLGIVEAVRQEVPDLPLHVLGLGSPEIVSFLFKAGVDSVDSSSYVKLAANGKLWSTPEFEMKDPAPTDRLHLALCNLAFATGQTLPLSSVRLVFSSFRLNGTQPYQSTTYED